MTLPVGFVSDDRVDYLEGATDKRVMQARPDKIDPDITFTQMLARERQTDNEKFTWRGQEYINSGRSRLATDPRLGVTGYNKPKRTPNHPTKSHIVVAKVGNKIKTIRFGQQGAKDCWQT